MTIKVEVKVEVTSCKECPHCRNSTVPVCGKTGKVLDPKDSAIDVMPIPEWCPYQDPYGVWKVKHRIIVQKLRKAQNVLIDAQRNLASLETDRNQSHGVADMNYWCFAHRNCADVVESKLDHCFDPTCSSCFNDKS